MLSHDTAQWRAIELLFEANLCNNGKDMMHITMLGTGNALVTACYNTCFVVHDGDKKMLVDGGGGSQILTQLEKADIGLSGIHDVFVTHRHIDHLLGIIWVIRIISQRMNKGCFDGNVQIYAHRELIDLMQQMCAMLLQAKQTKYIGDRICFVPVEDGETRTIIGHACTFFDTHSTKTKQFGFCMELDDGKKLTCCGDEPCHPLAEKYVCGSQWLLHEAFCLYEQADKYRPYEKNHSTVKDACELAERLNVRNLVLYHTEDDNIRMRKVLYYAEGSRYYHGRLLIPDDLEIISL